MLRILLIPIGSAGDVHPFVGLGTVLRERGHDVCVLTNPKFESLVQQTGLHFLPLGTEEEFDHVAGNPDLWKPVGGFKLIAKWAMLHTLRDIFETIAGQYRPGETVVAAQVTALGARVAHEKLGVPLCTVDLQPAVLRSVYQTPTLPPMLSGDRVPRWLKRFQFWLADKLVDPIIAPELNAFRMELGLPPVRRVLGDWWHSPERIVGLFPDWFAPQQPDWPPQTVLTGFPLWDEREATAVPPELECFLTAGDPPIVFTPGSAMLHGREFFQAATDACVLLGRRGVLLTRHAQQIPRDLPEGVRHFEYAPFSLILPRASAAVHHGGIGSLAQALAAGAPQLVMPMAHDQFDNAARAVRLGVGEQISVKHFRGPRVAAALRRIVESEPIAENCRNCAARFSGANGLDDAATEIEKLAGRDTMDS